MDIRVLYTIVAIAEHGSFLAASRALSLSPAAVSLHVKIIEEELGATLFDRSVRPPVLTDAGRRTLERARRVLAAWEELGDNGPNDVTGALTVGAVPTAVAPILAPGLAELHRCRPHLRVSLTTGYAEELEERLSRGMIDAALTMQPSPPPVGFRFAPVVAETFQVVAPAGTAGDDDAALLQSLPYIRFRGHAWIAQLIDQELNRRRLPLEAAMEIDTLSGVLALVEAGLGVSIVPERRLGRETDGRLRALPFGRPAVARMLGLLWRPDQPKAPQITELLQALLAVTGTSADHRQDERVDRGDTDGEAREVAEIHPEHEPADGHVEEP